MIFEISSIVDRLLVRVRGYGDLNDIGNIRSPTGSEVNLWALQY